MAALSRPGIPPPALSIEKPAANLASLVVNESLARLSAELIGQWNKRDRFSDVAKYGIRPLDRALFYGPPGNGKTMAAQMVAHRLRCPLYRVRSEMLRVSAFGGTQKNTMDVMDWLAGQDMAVVLWDECETLFPSRKTAGTDACSNEIVNTMQLFWQRLDRWESPQIFLMATNVLDRIDEALLSRVDLQIEFGPPTAEQALAVVEYWCEVFHEYRPDAWGNQLRASIDDGKLPTSFRELWQTISSAVRLVIASEAAT